MMFFLTRSAARSFARKTGRKLVDLGTTAARRWAVQVVQTD